MKNRLFVIASLVIVGSWFVAQLVHYSANRRILKLRHSEISMMRKDIEKLKESLKRRVNEAVSNNDLIDVTEIQRLESQIIKLRMETVIDQSHGHKDIYPDFFPILLLVLLSIQIGLLDKKLNDIAGVDIAGVGPKLST